MIKGKNIVHFFIYFINHQNHINGQDNIMVPTNQVLISSSPTSPPTGAISTSISPPRSSSLSLASTSSASSATIINSNNHSNRISDVEIFNFSENIQGTGGGGGGGDEPPPNVTSLGSNKSYALSTSHSYPSVPLVTQSCHSDGPAVGKETINKSPFEKIYNSRGPNDQNKSSSSSSSIKLNESFSSISSLVSNSQGLTANTSTIITHHPPSALISSLSPTASSSPITDSHVQSFSSSSSPPTIIAADGNPLRQYSRSHQRRFHRRFPAVDQHEKLIDWYSCALVADILLQGYLYISENYFAFYSNILGYKTQLLIPICDVISVTKEKTAKIFPNAVGICTDQTKICKKKNKVEAQSLHQKKLIEYVFGSLLSRESTFRLMQEVWKSTLIQVVSLPYFSPVIQLDKMIKCEADILIEKPVVTVEEEDEDDEDDDDDEVLKEIRIKSSASMTAESMKNTITTTTNSINNNGIGSSNNGTPSLLFTTACIKPKHSDTIKLVTSEIPSIQRILSSTTHQQQHETDSSGSDSEVNRDSSSSIVYQDTSTNLSNESSTNKHQEQSIGLTYRGSRLLVRTKNWLISAFRPYQHLLCNQITDTTRLLVMTTTLLIMLFISALIFLYRVEQVHNELLSLQQNTETNDFNQVQLKQIELRKQIKKLVSLLEEKTMELSVLKERIEEILNSYNHLSTCPT